MELFNIIISKALSPNQCYVLSCIHRQITPACVNLHQELRTLITGEWLAETDIKGKPTMVLQQKAFDLLSELENLTKSTKKTVNPIISADDYSENVKKYNEIFPKLRIPTSKMPARGAQKNLEKVFKWFFTNYEYSWDVVFKATTLYVDECERNNYNYMRTSQYFIKKQELDKTVLSKLADYCCIIESGEDYDMGQNHFSEKVV